MISSTPNVFNFKPLPGQWDIIHKIRRGVDYNLGTHEILLMFEVFKSKRVKSPRYF